MATELNHPLKREIEIGGEKYTLTLTQEGFTLVPKGRRKGFEMSWSAFVSGDAALATALNASLANAPKSRPAPQVDSRVRKRT
jgi:hypothetical protein